MTEKDRSMTAMEIVQKMMDDFEMKSGKPATEIILAGSLYDSLKREIKAQLPADMQIDSIKLRGVMIQRQVLQ
jgi:hypothetical protein